MPYRVVWTKHASEDVDRLVAYISVKLGSPMAAQEHLRGFLDAVDTLAATPEIHAVSPTPSLKRRNIRPFYVKNYVMLYSIEGDTVIIHRVFHTRQDYARLIEEES